jgi:hypothetical protein
MIARLHAWLIAAIILGGVTASAALAQAPAAPPAETDLQAQIKAGGVLLTGDQTRALQVGNTYYYVSRAGNSGAFYTAPDGRYVFKNQAGDLRQGVWAFTANRFVMNPVPNNPAGLVTIKGPEGLYKHFVESSGNFSDVVTAWKPGNPENLPLPAAR